MRIQRNPSRLTFRRQRRRRSGCLSWAVLLGLLAGVAAVSWSWIGGRLNLIAGTRGDPNALAAAEAAFAQGDLDSAIDHARRALEQNAGDESALTLLVRALIYRSYTDYDRAIDRHSALDLTTEALARGGSTVGLLAIHAYALQAGGQPAEAARTANEALEIDPNHALARAALGLAYAGAGSFEIALRESQQAAASGGWALETWRAVAISYSDLGDYQSAIRAVESAIAIHPRLIPLYFERALYALQIGDAGAATAAYFQVLTYDPDNVKARLRLCELSSLLRERDAALNYCTQVTTLAPGWADGWYQLGMEHFYQGDFASAQGALNRCSSLQVMQNVPVNERRFECWYVQGQAAEILGDCEGLLATYNEFRAMAADAAVQQTWTYPPEGPPGCVLPATAGS